MPHSNSIPFVFVPIAKNQVTIVDAGMAEYALAHKWTWRDGYASRQARKGEPGWVSSSHRGPVIFLHGVISGCPKGQETDHINRNRLDNRRENLRCATRSENMANKPVPAGVGKYRGVRLQELRRKDSVYRSWQARIKKNGEYHHLGTFPTPEDAALAYDRKAVELFGDFATLNFPENR